MLDDIELAVLSGFITGLIESHSFRFVPCVFAAAERIIDQRLAA